MDAVTSGKIKEEEKIRKKEGNEEGKEKEP